MESRLYGKCSRTDQFSLILNYVPLPWFNTLRIHSHMYLLDFIDISLKKSFNCFSRKDFLEFDLLVDPEECWGLILVMNVETMKSVGWK